MWIFCSNLALVSASFALVWCLYLRTYLLRRYYEKQGIPFIKECQPVIGAELQVSQLRKRNQSHDWLYINKPLELVGTIRGFSVQLYATSAEMSDKVIQQTGSHIDRNTPALYSFGQLSPYAITFTRVAESCFRQRKASLTRALSNTQRLFEIANRQTMRVLNEFQVGDKEADLVVDAQSLLDSWTRETSGEFIWGRNNIDCAVEVLDSNGNKTKLPFMTALNHTFTDLGYHSRRFWNRLCFPLAAWPVTGEARRLAHNVRVLRAEMGRMLLTPEIGSVAEKVRRENDKAGIPIGMTRDDLVTATIAGLDTVKSTIMGTLWHILQDENTTWREEILAEIAGIEFDYTVTPRSLQRCKRLNAMVNETLRFEPPGSLINNEATTNFDLNGSQTYKIKSGTRIVPCIHALHHNDFTWRAELQEEPTTPLQEFDPSRFLTHGNQIVGSRYFMPFGKGPRRCPGQGVGLSMVKCFVANFLVRNPTCKINLPAGQDRDITHFNILSRATFNFHCSPQI